MNQSNGPDRQEPASNQLDEQNWLGAAPRLRADTDAPELPAALARQLSASMGDDTPPPPQDRFGTKGGALAIAAHLVLLAMLFFSIQWSTKPPVALRAELWTALPAPASEPAPEPEPVPAPPPPPVVEKPVPPPPIKPDIALPDEKKKPPKVVKEEPKKEPPKKEPPKKEEPKKEPPKKEEPKPVKDEAKKPAPADPALTKLRDEEMKRALAAAGGPPGPVNANVNAAGVRGDPGYSDKIRGRILGNIIFTLPSDMAGNPEVVFAVEQLPTGEILTVKKIKSSGVPAWDDAVERGIRKSDPLPKNKDGSVVRQLELSFRPKDAR